MRNKDNKKKLLLIAALIIILLFLIPIYNWVYRLESNNNKEMWNMTSATVIEVIDAFNIKVDIDGMQYIVKPIGIELDNPTAEQAARLSNTVNNALKPGTTIYLLKDVTQVSDDGSLPRYIWFKVPNDITDEKYVRNSMYNAGLILEGYVRYRNDNVNIGYSNIFSKIQEDAINSKAGVWK